MMVALSRPTNYEGEARPVHAVRVGGRRSAVLTRCCPHPSARSHKRGTRILAFRSVFGY